MRYYFAKVEVEGPNPFTRSTQKTPRTKEVLGVFVCLDLM